MIRVKAYALEVNVLARNHVDVFGNTSVFYCKWSVL